MSVFKKNELGKFELLNINNVNVISKVNAISYVNDKIYISSSSNIYVLSTSENSTPQLLTRINQLASIITSLDVDSNGVVYCGTINGIFISNPSVDEATNQLSYQSINLTNANGLASNTIYEIKLFNENVFIAGLSTGIHFITKNEDGSYTVNPIVNPNEDRNPRVDGILKSKTGKYYFYNISSQKIYSSEIVVDAEGNFSVNRKGVALVNSSNSVTKMIHLNNNKILATTNYGLRFLTESDALESILDLDSEMYSQEGLTNNLINGLHVGLDSNIYLTTNGGIHVIKKNESSYEGKLLERPFKNAMVYGITLGANGNIYVTGGISFYALDSNYQEIGSFRNNTAFLKNLEAIGDSVYASAVNGLHILKLVNGAYTSTVISSASHDQITNNYINDFVLVNDYLYLATDSGIFVLKKNDQAATGYDYVTLINGPQLQDDKVKALEEYNGSVFAAIENKGFDKISKADDDVFTVEKFNSQNNIVDFKILNNKIYAASLNYGYSIIDLVTGVTQFKNVVDGFSSKEATTIFIRDEKVYIGTRSGLTIENLEYKEN